MTIKKTMKFTARMALMIALGASKMTFAAQAIPQQPLVNNNAQPQPMLVPQQNNQNAKPQVGQNLGKGNDIDGAIVVMEQAGPAVKKEKLIEKELLRQAGLNEAYGLGDVDPLMKKITYYQVLSLRPFRGKDNSFRLKWESYYGSLPEQQKRTNKKYSALDILKCYYDVGGKNALKQYHNFDAKKRMQCYETELNETNRLQRLQEWVDWFQNFDKFGETKRMKMIAIYLSFVVFTGVAIYGGYKFLQTFMPKLAARLLAKRPKIIKEERLSWRLWFTNRVMWKSKVPKSNIAELHYNDELQGWLDNELAADKRCVAVNTGSATKIPFEHLLLIGDPGVGKTVLAKAWAAECGFDWLHIGGSSWSQLPEAEAIKHLKDTLERAQNSPIPVLVFIDEAEAPLRDRNRSTGVCREITINFLAEVEKSNDANIKFVFATNLPDELDPAVRSRCGKSLAVPAPAEKVCQKIYKTYMDKYCDKYGLKHEKVDTKLHGLTGRDIEGVCFRIARHVKLKGDTLIRAEYIEREFADKLAAKQPKEAKLSNVYSMSWDMIGYIIAAIIALFAIIMMIRRLRRKR